MHIAFANCITFALHLHCIALQYITFSLHLYYLCPCLLCPLCQPHRAYYIFTSQFAFHYIIFVLHLYYICIISTVTRANVKQVLHLQLSLLSTLPTRHHVPKMFICFAHVFLQYPPLYFCDSLF